MSKKQKLVRMVSEYGCISGATKPLGDVVDEILCLRRSVKAGLYKNCALVGFAALRTRKITIVDVDENDEVVFKNL